jgi:hypothetical protein
MPKGPKGDCHAVAATDAHQAGIIQLSGHALGLVRLDA